MNRISQMNRKQKERTFSLGLIVIGLLGIFYGVWNYWLWVLMQHIVNLAWFVLFESSGIVLAVLGAVYTVLSYSYFSRINRINQSLK